MAAESFETVESWSLQVKSRLADHVEPRGACSPSSRQDRAGVITVPSGEAFFCGVEVIGNWTFKLQTLHYALVCSFCTISVCPCGGFLPLTVLI